MDLRIGDPIPAQEASATVARALHATPGKAHAVHIRSILDGDLPVGTVVALRAGAGGSGLRLPAWYRIVWHELEGLHEDGLDLGGVDNQPFDAMHRVREYVAGVSRLRAEALEAIERETGRVLGASITAGDAETRPNPYVEIAEDAIRGALANDDPVRAQVAVAQALLAVVHELRERR